MGDVSSAALANNDNKPVALCDRHPLHLLIMHANSKHAGRPGRHG